jgi:hypothetical protein
MVYRRRGRWRSGAILLSLVAGAVVGLACRANQDMAAVRERAAAAVPVRARLTALLGTSVDVELHDHGTLVIRWEPKADQALARAVASDLRAIAASLKSAELSYERVRIEALVKSVNYQRRIIPVVGCLAIFERAALESVATAASPDDLFSVAQTVEFHPASHHPSGS